jgi:NADP-dependent aldehyde dehydrogenase
VIATSSTRLEAIVRAAAKAAPIWACTPPPERAGALVAVADALLAASEELVGLAIVETGLGRARLDGELNRTAVQLRLFADVVADGSYLDVRIDEADPDFVLGSRPDVRRYLVPVGPVVNFAASNFPFAFSVAGGDTAAALAAGCPVILKAHSGHPELSKRTGELVAAALGSAGAPSGVFQVIHGQDAGVAALRHPLVAAGSFTGSLRVGRLLADIAAAREAPIPFFGELGSVNPVFVTRAALVERATAIVDGFLASVGGSAGQLCTKPGFHFVPSGHGLDERLAELAAAVEEHRMLNPSIAEGYRRRREAILAADGIRVIAEGSLRLDEDKQAWVTPTLVATDVAGLSAERSALLDEAFGPLSILVEYGDDDDLAAVAAGLFEGNLTGTVHTAEGEDTSAVRELVRWLTRHSGRVLLGGWPTGVAVTPAMQHGGPWPATTDDRSTSVGTAAISRFLRPVAYQSAPQSLLPEPLRDDNPWCVPQTRARAGESRTWGSRR